MSLGIGMIGLGSMGGTHLRILATQIGGAHVAALCDASADRAADAAAAHGGVALTDPQALIARADVQAVVVASPDETHRDCVMACLAAGKPVLCEKPLAHSVDACHEIVATEARLGRRLVHLGFMRRFDPSYRALKASFDAGAAGDALVLRCTHRNAQAPGFFRLSMILGNSMVHDFDIGRWLLAADFRRIRVDRLRNADGTWREDPLLATLETTRGQLVVIENFMNAGYGYDIRTELVGTEGTLEMQPAASERIRRNGAESFAHVADYTVRFADAYRLQMQAWITALAQGRTEAGGATAFDGLRAMQIAAAGEASLLGGDWVEIAAPERPALYR